MASFAADAPRYKIVIVPGNGGGDVWECNWYGEVHEALSKFCSKQSAETGHAIDIILENMPDAHKARETIWVLYNVTAVLCTYLLTAWCLEGRCLVYIFFDSTTLSS